MTDARSRSTFPSRKCSTLCSTRYSIACSGFVVITVPVTRQRRHLERIGLDSENEIAIDSEARDPDGGNVYYVVMQIKFHIPEFARKERNLHCDVVHITTICVSRLVLAHAIAAIQASR